MRIAVLGASGKTGSIIVDEILKNRELYLSAAIVSEKSNLLGKKIGEVAYSTFTENAIKNSDVLIDFSNPTFSINAIGIIAKHNIPVVVGTTGFDERQEEQIKEYAKNIPIFKSANFSIGINVMLKVLPDLVKSLNEFDIEIVETHHKHKKDAPSGTALLLINEITKDLSDYEIRTHERFLSNKPRGIKEIGVSSIRGGNVFGEHEVIFMNDDEEITIIHKANNRKIFAKGAINAAIWLIKNNSNPGIYSHLI